MTDEQKTNWLRIALGVCGIAINNRNTELIWRTHESLLEKKGKFSVNDSSDIEYLINKKYAPKEDNKKLIKEKLKPIPHEKLKDKYLGKRGTTDREKYQKKLKKELAKHKPKFNTNY